jgi:putative oxygen-independent coproporphyrinogen III oxidase
MTYPTESFFKTPVTAQKSHSSVSTSSETEADSFGVYLHWPFCASKCPYCDFNSHVRHKTVDQERFADAFIRELTHLKRLKPEGAVASIFLGGGTPSLMEPRIVGRVLGAISRLWTMEDTAEITLEANPSSVEAHRFSGYRAAGVNRISLGVQSLNAEDLKYLGRLHTVDEALKAVETAARIFERFSFDLIYTRPAQTLEAWHEELERAFTYAGDHLSLYQLTIEPETMFEKLYRAGKLTLPDEATSRALYDLTQNVCEAHGMPAYEVSNHARKGQESRHNLIYWRSGDYLGVGPGAHGRITTSAGRLATSTLLHPETWLQAVETNEHGMNEMESLSSEARADEFLLMGLRLREGIDLARFEAIAGRPLEPRQIEFLKQHAFVESTSEGRLRVTREGFPVLNAVVADLAA